MHQMNGVSSSHWNFKSRACRPVDILSAKYDVLVEAGESIRFCEPAEKTPKIHFIGEAGVQRFISRSGNIP